MADRCSHRVLLKRRNEYHCADCPQVLSLHPKRIRRESDLREARLRAGISQRELARRMGMGHSNVSRIERGDIPEWPAFHEKAIAVLGPF